MDKGAALGWATTVKLAEGIEMKSKISLSILCISGISAMSICCGDKQVAASWAGTEVHVIDLLDYAHVCLWYLAGKRDFWGGPGAASEALPGVMRNGSFGAAMAGRDAGNAAPAVAAVDYLTSAEWHPDGSLPRRCDAEDRRQHGEGLEGRGVPGAVLGHAVDGECVEAAGLMPAPLVGGCADVSGPVGLTESVAPTVAATLLADPIAFQEALCGAMQEHGLFNDSGVDIGTEHPESREGEDYGNGKNVLKQKTQVPQGTTAFVHAVEAHVSNPLRSTTRAGTEKRRRHWGHYAGYMLGMEGCVAARLSDDELRKVRWPPAQTQWLGFLTYVRERTSSTGGLRGIVEDVCSVGRAFHPATESGGVAPDPQKLYSFAHGRFMTALHRHYEHEGREVKPITMEEAHSGPNFVDPNCLPGMLRGLAWTLGCTTGRRPRTLAEIRLRDMKFSAAGVVVAGESVLVPEIVITYADEKFMDTMGKRSTREQYDETEDYDLYAKRGAAFWAYRSLVWRGAFEKGDPLMHVERGKAMPIKRACMDWVLFPTCLPWGDSWVDTVPIAPSTLSEWNKVMLKAMGSEPRGFSAHRKGLVTRAVVANIIKNKGASIDFGVEEVLVRLGGWDVRKGRDTVRKHYISKIIDQYVNPFALAYNRLGSEKEWAARMRTFMGKERQPDSTLAPSRLCYAGRYGGVPMYVRMMAITKSAHADLRERANAMGREVLLLAHEDPDVCVIKRYMSSKEAVNAIAERQPHAPRVRAYKRMLQMWNSVYTSCLQASKNEVTISYMGQVLGCLRQTLMFRYGCSMYLRACTTYELGHMTGVWQNALCASGPTQRCTGAFHTL